LGYLNFSDGRADPRWQRLLDDAFAAQSSSGAECPWDALLAAMAEALSALEAGGGAAFRDTSQARAALTLAAETFPVYRLYHADLLAHLDDAELFAPFFMARVFEACLQLLRHPEIPATADLVVARLNDFVGHRPIAMLETRPQGEPYERERHRPVPIFLRGAGAASGRYRAVVERTLELLRSTDAGVLGEASLNLDQLEELAIDMRAYDHGHPVNRRPNYVFGEWDPHHIDNKGRYSRYVIRKITLDALMDRVETAVPLDPAERLTEGAAVLAGTILMAAGVSGWGPGAHDSMTTLAVLLPRIARYRDVFYTQLLERIPKPHADRLRRERESTRQPFGAARQHLNAYLARHRATQMQQRHLALLFGEMGYPDASLAEAARIQTVSVRLQSEILGRIHAAEVSADRSRLDDAASLLPDVEDALLRGIACGAFADPWNMLGFQGLFPLSAAREDAIRDPRLEELVHAVEQTFSLYARLMSEAAAADDPALVARLGDEMEKFAAWWDPFAGAEVSDLRRVHGGEAVESARNVAAALAAWRERGEAGSDLAFWRDRLDDFGSARAFALVVEALLARHDHRAALGLLASWLGQSGATPLEDGNHSFYNLALRWMLTLTQGDPAERLDPTKRADLAARFFDLAEANAEDLWQAPRLFELLPMPREIDDDETDDDPYSSAYEDVTFRDSTDNSEGAVSDGEPKGVFDLEDHHERLEKHLRFLSTLARLWQIAARFLVQVGRAVPEGWETNARSNRHGLLELLDALHSHPLPEPEGDADSLIEYDRRRVIKEQLIYSAINTCLDTSLAVGALGTALAEGDAPPWQPEAQALERSLFAGDADAARDALGRFVRLFRNEPLLLTPLSEGPGGGEPRGILRVRMSQAVLRSLLANLPRLGLMRETYELLRTARSMEQTQPTRGRGVTEFNQFFQSAYQSVVENVVRSSGDWPDDESSDGQLVDILERLTAPFLALWIEHSRSLQLSVLEGITEESEWKALTGFVQRYGGELFHARFMTLGNLRGILHRGVRAYLDYLQENDDPLRPLRLLDDIDNEKRREEAVKRLELVLQAVVENYEEYKDYNTTTTQSDYGENLHVLLDFLRLKSQYDRHAWQFRPLILAHEVLTRHGRPSTALRWQESLVQFSREFARQHLEQLAVLERRHGVRISTIGDRLGERFVKPLALDRLCALIEPCIEESRTIDREEDRPTFARLRDEMRTYTATPTGVGLDVPSWLRRLESEVHRVEAGRGTVAVLAENFFRIPRHPLSHDEVAKQLREWERPALPS
jgi:hypothetical protein